MKYLHLGKLNTKVLFMLALANACILIFAGFMLHYSLTIEQDYHRVIEIAFSGQAASAEINQADIDHIIGTELLIDNQIRLIWMGALASIIALNLAVWLFTQHQIVKPVWQLIDKFKRLAHGEQNIEFRTDRMDELGELGACFNEMNINLSQAMEAWDLIMESQAATTAVIDTSADAILTLDEHGRISSTNNTAGTILGFDQFDVTGKSFFEKFIPQDQHELYALCFSKVKESGHCDLLRQYRVITALRANGDSFPAEISIAHVMQKGAPVFIVFMRDITDRKQAEIELKRSRDTAIELAQTKADFLANISHELRTPMNGVLGMLSVMEHSRNRNPAMQEYIDAATQSANNLLQLINNLVDFARLDSGRLEIKRRDFSLKDFLARLGQITQHKAQLKNLEFMLDHELHTDAIHADPVRLGQVLMHLLDNAIKFTDTGHVRLAIDQRLRQTGQIEINFRITDTGTGISEDNRNKLFQAFTQLDGSRDRKHGGTGIGLTYCKQTLDLLGGHIQVTSTPGKGSTFTVNLPVSPAKNSQALCDVSKLSGLEGMAATDGDTIINQRLFSELLALLPPDDLRLLINTFKTSTQQKLEQLRIAISHNNTNAILDTAHNIKSGCSSFYAEAIINACNKLEQTVHSGILEKTGSQLAKVENEYQRLQLVLDEYL